MFKGIFWYANDNLITVKVRCDNEGDAIEPCCYSAKSGDNFNHKAEWAGLSPDITKRLPYNYYPRGRVEIKNSRITVWLNPVLREATILERILTEFELKNSGLPVVFKADGSAHYNYLERQ